jgi:peptidoglycan/xylan/chitin deacetylase (PgdA/CDA1 family)
MRCVLLGSVTLVTWMLAGVATWGAAATPASPVSTNAPTASAPLPAAPVSHVAQYLGDRAAAISYTFDDGTHDQLAVVPLLNAHGFHGTFLIIASRVPDTEAQVAAQHMVSWGSISWEKLREIQAEGHEMSSHSWSHPQLSPLDDAGIRAEVEKADQLMTEKLGQPPLTFCYPYNNFNDRVRAIVLEHHVNDRTTCVGLAGPTFTQDFANEWVDGLIHDHGWGVTMIHNVSNTDPNATNLTVLNGQMDYVKSRADAVWVDTFLNVSLYTKERDAAKVSVTMTGPQQADVLLACPLPRAPYTHPLTVVVALPGVTKASATQAISSIPVTVSKDAVRFDVVPGPEPTTLTWSCGGL